MQSRKTLKTQRTQNSNSQNPNESYFAAFLFIGWKETNIHDRFVQTDDSKEKIPDKILQDQIRA